MFTLVELILMIRFITRWPDYFSKGTEEKNKPIQGKSKCNSLIDQGPNAKTTGGVSKRKAIHALLSTASILANLIILVWSRKHSFNVQIDQTVFSNSSLVLFGLWSGIRLISSLESASKPQFISLEVPGNVNSTEKVGNSGLEHQQLCSRKSVDPFWAPYKTKTNTKSPNTLNLASDSFRRIKKESLRRPPMPKEFVHKRNLMGNRSMSRRGSPNYPTKLKQRGAESAQIISESPLAVSTTFTSLIVRDRLEVYSFHESPYQTSFETFLNRKFLREMERCVFTKEHSKVAPDLSACNTQPISSPDSITVVDQTRANSFTTNARNLFRNTKSPNDRLSFQLGVASLAIRALVGTTLIPQFLFLQVLRKFFGLNFLFFGFFFRILLFVPRLVYGIAATIFNGNRMKKQKTEKTRAI